MIMNIAITCIDYLALGIYQINTAAYLLIGCVWFDRLIQENASVQFLCVQTIYLWENIYCVYTVQCMLYCVQAVWIGSTPVR